MELSLIGAKFKKEIHNLILIKNVISEINWPPTLLNIDETIGPQGVVTDLVGNSWVSWKILQINQIIKVCK